MASERQGDILGQEEVANGSWTTLYTVPGGRQAEFTIDVCNRSGAARTYKIRMRPGSDSAWADKHIVADDIPAPNGIPHTSSKYNLGDGGIVEGQANGADVNMMVNGIESFS